MPFSKPFHPKMAVKASKVGEKIGSPTRRPFCIKTDDTKSALVFDSVDISPSDLYWRVPKSQLHQNLTLACQSGKCGGCGAFESERCAQKCQGFSAPTWNCSLVKQLFGSKPSQEPG